LIDTAESYDTSTVILTPRTGSNDSVDVELAHGTAGSAIDLTSLTLDGFESATVTASGTNKTETDTSVTEPANNIDTIAGTVSDTSLTIAGTQKLTAGVENTWTTINVTNTKSSDLTVASGGDLTYTAGAGNDRLELDTMADITSADTLSGGGGKDTLALSQTIGTDFSATQLAAFSGFEVLEYEGTLTLSGNTTKTVDLTKITDANELTLTGTLTTDSNDLLYVKAADGFVANVGVTSGAANQVEFQITGAATAGTANTVNVNLANTGSGVTNVGFTVDNVETVNLNVAGDFTSSDKYTLSDIDGAVLQTLNIASTNTGREADGTATVSDDLTITTIESTLLTTLNAGSFTGALDVSGLAAAYAATGATITGGSGADVIYAGTGADTINAGAGGDTIRGGTGADVINAAAGADVVLAATGVDSTPEKQVATFTEGTVADGDDLIVTILGVTFSQDIDTADATKDTLDEAGALLAAQINAHADIGKLVVATAGTGAATTTVVTTEALVDGDFADFAVSNNGLTGGTDVNTSGTNSTDVDVVNLGAGADFVHTSGGIDLVDLGAADGAADTVYILNLTEGADVISNFEAGSIGTDVVKFAADLLNNGTDTSTLVSIASTGATVDNRVFFEITTATAAGAADTAAEIVTHLTGLTLTSVTSGDDVVFAVNDGTDTYLWQFTEDGSAGIQADDLTLVGELAGVTDIVNGDLGQIA
jgi:Ca2+-binding RTX toxin-like protein